MQWSVFTLTTACHVVCVMQQCTSSVLLRNTATSSTFLKDSSSRCCGRWESRTIYTYGTCCCSTPRASFVTARTWHADMIQTCPLTVGLHPIQQDHGLFFTISTCKKDTNQHDPVAPCLRMLIRLPPPRIFAFSRLLSLNGVIPGRPSPLRWG